MPEHISTAHYDVCHPRALIISVNHGRVPALALADVRELATDHPEILADAASYARRFYPRAGSLVRAA